MKKLTLLILPFLFLALPHAYAQTLGQPCPDFTCGDQSLVCKAAADGTNPTCQPNTAVQSSGTCTVDAGCVNYGAGWTCQIPAGQTSGTCVAPTGGANAGNTNASTGFVPLAPIPGLTDTQSGANASSLPQFLQNLYKYLIGIAAVLAVIEIIYGGLQYATQDSVSKKGEGRERIEHALLGLALVLSPALVFSIINPSILNLSLNLPALNTAGSGSIAPSGTGSIQNGTGAATTGATTGSSAGCNTPTGGTAYQSVSCATNDAAATWNSLFCGGGGIVQGPSACKSGGAGADGTCSDGTLNWSVFCPGTSSQSWELYTESIPGFWSSFSPTSNITWAPVPSNANAVEGYVSACTSGYVCLPGGIGSTVSAIWTNSVKPVCPSGQSYPKFSGDSSNPQPYCITTQIRCTDAAHTGCLGGTVLDASP